MRVKIFFPILFLSLFLGACARTPPAANDKAAPEPSTAAATPQSSPLTDFEQKLQYVRNGSYTYVFIFSRKDGKPLAPEDSAVLRTNAPQVVDWVVTDDKKKVVAGTNFNLEEGNMDALKKRFVVENYSGR